MSIVNVFMLIIKKTKKTSNTTDKAKLKTIRGLW